MTSRQIVLKHVNVHNLKNVNLTLDHHKLIVFTGVSGSGKSSLAFDTIYVEGQRRYIESLSTYARRHLGDFPKPDAESLSGLSPTIAIEQKTAGQNPRSTVGTMTAIYDFLRVLFARVGTAHCPISHEVVTPQSAANILATLSLLPEGEKVIILSPFAKSKKGSFKEEFADLLRKGFTRIRLDGKWIELENEVSIDGKVAHTVDLVIDRLTLSKDNETRLSEAVHQALDKGAGMLSVLRVESNEELFFSQHASSIKSGISYPPLEPSDFSFNHPAGMCPKCQGLGKLNTFDLEKIIDETKSIAQDCCSVASSYQTVRYGNIYNNLATLYKFKIDTPWKKLSQEAKHAFLYGIDKKWTKMRFVHPETKHRWTEYVHWKGVINEAMERFTQATSDLYKAKLKPLMCESLCDSCHGARIRPYPAATTIGGKTLPYLTALPIRESLAFFKAQTFAGPMAKVAAELMKEIIERLHFLNNVGLHYLSLDRTAPTLSGGEAQRVRLACQIGSGLVGATYVLDEPSIGLHPRDNAKLIETLIRLRDVGNTVIVVEHDEDTIAIADEIIDVGPRAGAQGGEIVIQGTFQDLLNAPHSLTGAYLSGRKQIPIPQRRAPTTFFTLTQACHHNLQKVDLEIPLGLFTAITGVSGSGKSSLITDTLYPLLVNKLHHGEMSVGKHGALKGAEQIDKVIAIDQTPIGKTPRSNPATFVKVFDDIRDLFANLPSSISQGYTAGRFSFNVKEGSCPHCSGMGMIRIDMDFMEDEWVVCEHCEGKRFDTTTLSVLYKGKNIHDILEMTIEEALLFFNAIPTIKTKLTTLKDVGLGYIKLGQPSPTLSGGEAQRVKLSKELCRPSSGNTLYILDEPTTGLHFYDIHNLLLILQQLVDKGNTLVVIEHNMDLVKTADWIVDLGPDGGKEGGRIVATGSPEMIVKKKTHTAIALKPYLNKKRTLTPQPPPLSYPPITHLSVHKASQNNLKQVSASIPRGAITICTGPSGSGKSSFAFETIYAEGQRRYIESMSPYARQFVKQSQKPSVEQIEGLSPAIAIEQKSHAGNPRSTIGTMTEAYDYLRILYAHLGIAHCPETLTPLRSVDKQFIADQILQLPEGTKTHLLSPMTLKPSDDFEEWKGKWQGQGFLRIRLNGIYYELDQEIPFDKHLKNTLFLVIDRLMISHSERLRLLSAIEQATTLSQGRCVADVNGTDLFFNLHFTSLATGKSYPPITPHTFSFNTESGMCLQCKGLGFQYGFDLNAKSALFNMTLRELVHLLWKDYSAEVKILLPFLKRKRIPLRSTLSQLSENSLRALFEGDSLAWKGFAPILSSLKHSFIKELLVPLYAHTPCPACQGSRLNPLAQHVTLNNLNIAQFCALSIDEAIPFLERIHLQSDKLFLQDTLEPLKQRLHFLQTIGIGYLSLDRTAPTLSGGETQRIRLARQLGSGLTGCLYVLDEPTIGLHPVDNAKLNTALKKLASLGNTLLLVEHDPLTMELADYILDFGPKAGKEGGRIVAQGTLEHIRNNPLSLTGAYLSGHKKIPIPTKRRKGKHHLHLTNAHLHNLQHLHVSIPLQAITCITGVSGSGKSTLMGDLLLPAAELAIKQTSRQKNGAPHVTYKGAELTGMEHIHQLLTLSQDPLGHTQRADVSTYVDLLTPLRYYFASLPEAVCRGLEPKHFSFNHKKGMCTACQGLGYRHISLQFLPPVKIDCDSCHGFRLTPLSLEVKSHGKHLGHLLKMSVQQAREFLPPIPKVIRILDTLITVGLGYLELGQEIASLSGGEAQRIRLSKELSKRSTGKTLYLLDEPTVGLHPDDIAKLLPIFHSLVDQGNTLIIIEHNLDVIATADHIIDIGPGAGPRGGRLVATGTPEELCHCPSSLTALHLKPLLH